MEPLSTLASIIAIYQLASTVGTQCFRYAQGISGTKKEEALVLDEIIRFQASLLQIREMITEEDGGTANRTRLKYLSQIVDGRSAPLRLCETELDNLRAKLDDASCHVGIKGIMHRLSWPLKREESSRAINTMRNFIHAVDMTLALDTNRTVRQLEDRLKQTQMSAE